MRIKAQFQDEQVFEEVGGFYEFCDMMGWERFIPNTPDFIHNGWRVSIEQEIAPNVFAAVSRIRLLTSRQEMAKMRQRYTPSLRPFNKACNQCKWIEGNKCSVGNFAVSMNGGCKEFK